ncbi:MAG TPA: peptidylprolyl isomerase [Solimonas sp.]|nr:peptidylprolyl isomerase [Solimonas sp.]
MAASIPRWLLLLGLAAGAAGAALNLAGPRTGAALPADAVARVGERLILRDDWQRAIDAVASDRRTPLTDMDRQAILDRLVDEQLLVEHGLALGLAEHDRRVRGDLVSAVMFAATTGRQPAQPDDEALQAFYRDHAELFAQPPHLRVAAWRIDASGARRPFMPPVPDALLPPAKLQAYLGPTLTAAALHIAPGSQSAPIASGNGLVVLELRERQDAPAADFAALREQVLAEYRRQADEAAVRELLAQLRSSYRVQVDTSAR